MLCCIVPASLAQVDTIYKAQPIKTKTKAPVFIPPFILKTSPTAFLWGGVFPFTAEYRLMAEITTGRRQSQQAGISYLGKSLFLEAIEKSQNIRNTEFKVSGWRVQYAIKFFWIGKRHHAPYGFYFGPMVSYANAHISLGLKRYYSNAYFDFRHFNINGIIGVQAGKINRVTLDIYAGLGYKNNKVWYHSTNNKMEVFDTEEFGDLYNSHLNGVFGVNLGYSF